MRSRKETNGRVVFVVGVVNPPRLEIAPEAIERLDFGPRRVDCAQKRTIHCAKQTNDTLAE